MHAVSHNLSLFRARFNQPHCISCANLSATALNSRSLEQKTDYILNLIYRRHLALNPKQINQDCLNYFGASTVVNSDFAEGLHRKEDKFILDGFKPYLQMAISGKQIDVCESGAGASYPIKDSRNTQLGLPWLSRSIKSTIPPSIASLNLTVSDVQSSKTRLIFIDGNGLILFGQVASGDGPLKDLPFTTLGQAVNLNEVLKVLHKVPHLHELFSNFKKACFEFNGAVAHVRPTLDPEFEKRYWNLNVADASNSNYLSNTTDTSTQNFDYIFGRHLCRRHAPVDMLKPPVPDIVLTMRSRLKPGGEARLVFDYDCKPKTSALVIRRDSVYREILD